MTLLEYHPSGIMVLSENSQKAVFTEEDINATMPNLGEGFPSMPIFDISGNGIEKLLTDLNSNKATGPDNIPGCILKLGLMKSLQPW